MRPIILLLLFIVSPITVFAQSSDYPGRDTYPNVKYYETAQLVKEFDDVLIVDVRSRYEYDVLHINGALHISVASKTFTQQLIALASGSKPIIFYCNGHTCYKSYKAVLKAKKAGLYNVFSYDSGIFDWANAQPNKATMLSVSPVNPDKLLSKNKLKEHLLNPKEFVNKITEDSIILDIRDPSQRGLMSLFPYRQVNISLQEKKSLTHLLNDVHKKKLPLLIYDAAGKQVRWLQYYIEAKGIKNYYFMKGGSKNYFKNS